MTLNLRASMGLNLKDFRRLQNSSNERLRSCGETVCEVQSPGLLITQHRLRAALAYCLDGALREIRKHVMLDGIEICCGSLTWVVHRHIDDAANAPGP